MAALALVIGGWSAYGGATAPPPTPVRPTAMPYDARGKVVPAKFARLVTLTGGTVRSARVAAGASVNDREEIARVESAGGTVDVVVAPFAGTLLSLTARIGDGLLPGSEIGQVGDLSSYEIETTDIDEYQIASVRVGQAAEISIDALGERSRFGGRVTSVTMTPRLSATGDTHYPITITLDRADVELRPGMTARLRFRRE